MDCLACGSTSAKASKEHVFSSWLLDYLRAKRVPMELFRRTADGGSIPHRTTIAYDSFRLNRICEGCNNGWMSDLETSAKPLIVGLMNGSTTLESLDANQRQLLARWAGKTAIIESYAVGAECPINAKILQWMRRNPDAEPGRFAVAARSMEYNAIAHLQAAPMTKLLDGRSVAVGNAVVLAVPKLVLICGFPDPNIVYDCRCDLSVCRPIWPEPGAWKQMEHLPDSRIPEGDWVDILFFMAERIEFKYRLR